MLMRVTQEEGKNRWGRTKALGKGGTMGPTDLQKSESLERWGFSLSSFLHREPIRVPMSPSRSAGKIPVQSPLCNITLLEILSLSKHGPLQSSLFRS